MSDLRDDMTLAEAQAEAERRWPGAQLDVMADGFHHHLRLSPLARPFVAGSPAGCLDQAIAAEARRLGPTPTHERCVACGTSVPISDWAAMSWHGLLVKGSRHG